MPFDADGNPLWLNRNSKISIQTPQTDNHWFGKRAQPVTPTTRDDFSLTFLVVFFPKKLVAYFLFREMVDYHFNNTSFWNRKDTPWKYNSWPLKIGQVLKRSRRIGPLAVPSLKFSGANSLVKLRGCIRIRWFWWYFPPWWVGFKWFLIFTLFP